MGSSSKQEPRIAIPGVDASRAINLSGRSPDFVDTGYEESLYKRDTYTVEIRYGYISGMHTINKALVAKSEGVPIQSGLCGACQQQVAIHDPTLSKDYLTLRARHSSLMQSFNELFALERELSKPDLLSCEMDVEERRLIGLEAAHCVKKMAEIRGIGKVEIVDKFYDSKT